MCVFVREQVWSAQGKDLKLHVDEVRLVSYADSAAKLVSAQGQLPPQADPFVWVSGDPTRQAYSLTCPTRQASQSKSQGGGYVPETATFAVPPPPPPASSRVVQTIEVRRSESHCTAPTTLYTHDGAWKLSDVRRCEQVVNAEGVLDARVHDWSYGNCTFQPVAPTEADSGSVQQLTVLPTSAFKLVLKGWHVHSLHVAIRTAATGTGTSAAVGCAPLLLEVRAARDGTDPWVLHRQPLGPLLTGGDDAEEVGELGAWRDVSVEGLEALAINASAAQVRTRGVYMLCLLELRPAPSRGSTGPAGVFTRPARLPHPWGATS